MRQSTSKNWLALAVATLGGCGAVQDELPGGLAYSGGVIDAGAPEGVNATGRGAGTGADTGLPCDVQQVIEKDCVACHLGTSAVALLDYEQLVSPAPSDPTKSLAALSLELMKSTTRAMPPPPAERSSTDDIGVFERWIAAGTPRGAACTNGPGASTGSPNPYDTPTRCTSNQYWTEGNEGSTRMRPGGACIACHTVRQKKRFTVAGTIYPTAHEPDDCNGSGGTTVEVTGSDGQITNIVVNSAGNFQSTSSVAPPFHVKVKSGSKERAMIGALTSGDCNSCHTAAGLNGAPGRVIAP